MASGFLEVLILPPDSWGCLAVIFLRDGDRPVGVLWDGIPLCEVGSGFFYARPSFGFVDDGLFNFVPSLLLVDLFEVVLLLEWSSVGVEPSSGLEAGVTTSAVLHFEGVV